MDYFKQLIGHFQRLSANLDKIFTLLVDHVDNERDKVEIVNSNKGNSLAYVVMRVMRLPVSTQEISNEEVERIIGALCEIVVSSSFDVICNKVVNAYLILLEYKVRMLRTIDICERIETKMSPTYMNEIKIKLQKMRNDISGDYPELVAKLAHLLVPVMRTYENVQHFRTQYRNSKQCILLYATCMQMIIDRLYEQDKSLFLKVVGLLEKDKSEVLNISKDEYFAEEFSTGELQDVKLHLINPPLRRFCMVPVTDSFPLDELVKIILPHAANVSSSSSIAVRTGISDARSINVTSSTDVAKPSNTSISGGALLLNNDTFNVSIAPDDEDANGSDNRDVAQDKDSDSAGVSAQSTNATSATDDDSAASTSIKQFLAQHMANSAQDHNPNRNISNSLFDLADFENDEADTHDTSVRDVHVSHLAQKQGIAESAQLNWAWLPQGVGVILIKSVVYTPIEYTIRALVTPTSLLPDENGPTIQLVKKFRTMIATPNCDWDFQYKVVNKTAHVFYILQTLNNKTYRCLAPYFSTKSYLVNRFKVNALLEFIEGDNLPARINNYQLVVCRKALDSVFMPRKLEIESFEERASNVPLQELRIGIHARIMDYVKDYVKARKKELTIRDLIMIIHDRELSSIFMRVVVEMYPRLVSLRDLVGNSGGDFEFAELYASFMVSLEYIARRFMKEMHDTYEFMPLSRDKTNDLRPDELHSVIYDKINDLVQEVLLLVLVNKDNLFTSLQYKYLLLNYK